MLCRCNGFLLTIAPVSICFCFGPKFSLWQFFKQNQFTSIIVFAFLLYFLIMDVLLYQHVQRLPPIFRPNATDDHNSTLLTSTPDNIDDHPYSPFEGLGVKMMMMDQPNDYVHIPMATLFNKVTKFSEIFYFITPNMISVASILVALLAAKFVTSDLLLHRQLAVLIFECRNFLDALDGAVFRSRSHLFKFVSIRTSSGGIVDGIADVVGFAAFLFGSYIYLKKIYARKNHNQNETLMTSLESCDAKTCSTKRSVLRGMSSFAFQIAYGAIAWNLYVDRFHKLLETPMPTVHSALVQNAILKSNLTWIFMWIWRLVNSHGLIEIFILFIFIDKLRELVVFLENKGVFLLTGLIILTELYYMDANNMLQAVAA